MGRGDRYLGLNPGLKSLVSCVALGRSFNFSGLTSTSVKLGCHSRLAEVLEGLEIILTSTLHTYFVPGSLLSGKCTV